MANLAGSYDPNAEPGGDFDPIPAGEYVAEIIDSDIEEISRRDNKGRRLKLTWKVAGGDFNGRLVWQRLNMWAENMNNLDMVQSIAQSQFAAVRHATGKVHVQDSNELHHIPCRIRVSVKTDQNYPPSNEVKNVAALEGAPTPAAAPAAFKAPPATAAKPAASGGGSAPWRQKQTA